MNNEKYIRLTKLQPVADPEVPTPTFEEYEVGQINDNVSIPVDYWIEGWLITEPVLGGYLLVDRKIRNGVVIGGIFQTSMITQITEDGFKTLNSIYKLEYVEEQTI